MIVKVYSAGLLGVEAYRLEIEVDGAPGMMSVLVVGLPDAAVKESQDRVRAAVYNSGYEFPQLRVTINLAPADVRKEGPAYDLPIALGLLAIAHQVDVDGLGRIAAIGELALDGRVRPIAGMLPITLELKKQGHTRLIVPEENAREAGVVDGIDILPVGHLKEAVGICNDTLAVEPFAVDLEQYFEEHSDYEVDFAEVKGQAHAKRAAVIAAAGGHNLLLIGPPGSGKSMIAKRLPTILPRLSLEEALETTKLHSIAGHTSREHPLVTTRPFRAPHHTISDAGLIGGGAHPRPGEVSLSHHGVLFLDELPEFSRRTLEVLRQPLEDGTVTIARAASTLSFPADFMLVAAMNPCPCGFRGHPKKPCTDSPNQVANYRNRISGPLLDRIDMHLEVSPVAYEDLANAIPGEPSAVIRARVQEARDLQSQRFSALRARSNGTVGVYCNAQMSDKLVKEHAKPDEQGAKMLQYAMETLNLSARAYTRILKLARTIADLEGCDVVKGNHIGEAIAYRTLDRPMLETI